MMREISCCFAGYLPLSLKVGGRRAGDNSPGGNGCGILVLTLVSCCRSPSSGMPRGATSRKSITQLLFLRMSWTSITPPLQRDRVRAGHRLLLQQPLPYSWGGTGARASPVWKGVLWQVTSRSRALEWLEGQEMLLSCPRARTRAAKAGLVWDTGSPGRSLVRLEQSLPAWPGSHWPCSTARLGPSGVFFLI